MRAHDVQKKAKPSTRSARYTIFGELMLLGGATSNIADPVLGTEAYNDWLYRVRALCFLRVPVVFQKCSGMGVGTVVAGGVGRCELLFLQLLGEGGVGGQTWRVSEVACGSEN